MTEIHRIDNPSVHADITRALLSLFELYNVITVPKLPTLETIVDTPLSNAVPITPSDITNALNDLSIDVKEVHDKFLSNVEGRK